MAYEPRKVGTLKTGRFMVDPDSEEACRIISIDHSKPGKHGAAKARIELIGLFTGKRKSFLSTVDKRVNVPIIDKKQMQITNVTDDSVQLMDSGTYEMYEEGLPTEDEVREQLLKLYKEGKAIQAEVWDVMNRKKIISVREMSI